MDHLEEEDEEAKRCRLDRSLFALLYHELMASRFESTAKRFLKEAGVESVELSNGIPPRLRDLVDIWNEVQTVPITRVFAKPAPPILPPAPKPSTSSLSPAAVATSSSASVSSHVVSSSGDGMPALATTTANEKSASAGTNGSTNGTDVTNGQQPAPRVRSGIYGMYLPPPSIKKSALLKEDLKSKTGKGTRGPWLQEEEQRLKDAIELYGESNLELIDQCVKSRSVKGIAKHLMKTKKGWGLEYNKQLFELLVASGGPPTLDQLLAIKPADKSEKDLISWLEWFIIHNNSFHSQEQYALDEKEKSERARAERERLEREACLEAHPNILDEAVVPVNSKSAKSAKLNGSSRDGDNGSEGDAKRLRLDASPWTPEDDETLKTYWMRYKGDVRRVYRRFEHARSMEDVAHRISMLQVMGAISKEDIFHSAPSITSAFAEPTVSSEETNRGSSEFIIKWTPDEIKAFNRVYSQTPGNIEALCAAVPRRTRGAVVQRLRDIADGRISLDGEPIKN